MTTEDTENTEGATPETDALWHEMTTGNYQASWWVAAERMRDHAKRLEQERDEAIRQRNETNESSKYAVNYAIRERDEARQRASDLALGVKVADCMYDYGKYSVALREAKIKARYLQELTRAAYDEVEKLEDQKGEL
jgi:hypothetical protein